MFTNYNLRNIFPEITFYPNQPPTLSTPTFTLLNNPNKSTSNVSYKPQIPPNFYKQPSNTKNIKKINLNEIEKQPMNNTFFDSYLKLLNNTESIIEKIKKIIHDKNLNDTTHLITSVCYYIIHEMNDIEYGGINELKELIKHFFVIKHIDDKYLINTILDMIKIKHNNNGKTEYVYNVYLLNDIEFKLIEKLAMEIYDWILSKNNHVFSPLYSNHPPTHQPYQPHQQQPQHKQYPQSHQSHQQKEKEALHDKINTMFNSLSNRISLIEENVDTIINQIKNVLNYNQDKLEIQKQIDDLNWILHELIDNSYHCKNKKENVNVKYINNINMEKDVEKDEENDEENMDSESDTYINSELDTDTNIDLIINDVKKIGDSIADEIIKVCN